MLLRRDYSNKGKCKYGKADGINRRDNCEKINRDDISGVVRQECSPVLGWRLAMANHILRDSCLADIDPKFE